MNEPKISRRSSLTPRKISLLSGEAEVLSAPESTENTPEHATEDEEGTNSSGDDANGFPFDLVAALQAASASQMNGSVASSTSSISSTRKRNRASTSSQSRWQKKASLGNETIFCYTLRGPNSLLLPNKSAIFTIGGVYELKCSVLGPPRQNYACKTVISLGSDNLEDWAKIDECLHSGTLLSGQPVPNHIITMDRPSPRTHQNVQAGSHSLEFSWDASGTIFVYLRFLCAVNDLISSPKAPLRLIIQSHFLEDPSTINNKSILIETIRHPILLETSIGSHGPIDISNDCIDRLLPHDHRVPLFEQSSLDLDDTDFVRSVINIVSKTSTTDSPLAVPDQTVHDNIYKADEASSSAQINPTTIREALGSLLVTRSGATPSSINLQSSTHTPRPRGRPRKFHYPEYCYSKTALERGPAHAGECSGPIAEMLAIQQMQKPHMTEAESLCNLIKQEIIDEKPINMSSFFPFQQQMEEIDKPSSSMEDVEPNMEMKKFLIHLKMSNYINMFAKYTMNELRLLSAEDLRIICGNDAEAIRLYHALRIKTTTGGRLSIFVAPQNDEGEEPCYELIKLSPPCASELAHLLRTKGLMDGNTRRICVDGPNGILVQLSDEIIESWEDNAVFQFIVTNGILKMFPVRNV